MVSSCRHQSIAQLVFVSGLDSRCVIVSLYRVLYIVEVHAVDIPTEGIVPIRKIGPGVLLDAALCPNSQSGS